MKSEVLHDSLGRLSSVRGFDDGVAAQTTYLYDAADDLVGAIDPLGNKTVFVRNLKGEVASVVDSDLGRRTVERDDVGNVTASVDAKLDRIIYSYDSLERLKTKLLPSQRLITLVYDEPASGASLGLHTSSIDTDATNCAANIVTRRNYDGAGQLAGATTCVDGVTLTFGVGHDAVGRLHSVTYPDMEEVFYAYDAAGRVRALSGIVDRIRYDAADRPRSIHFANGMLSTFSYEKNRDALRAETTWFGGARIFDAHYTYFDNLLLKTVNSYGDGSKYSYAYDGLSRLSTVRGDASTDYRYDLSGNLTYRSDLGILTYPGQGPFGCSPDLQTPQPCRLPHAVQSAGPFTFHYDGNGAAFDVERTGGSHRFIDWGGDHKPLRITDFDGAAAQYGYDGFGQRISRTTGGRTHRWFGALAEQDESGRLIKHYLIGGRRVASETSGSLSWFVSDRLNSIRAVVDASGNVIAQTKFQPFGSADPASTPGQFAGHQLEPSLPLIFMGSRLYDPAIGRFLIPDILVPSLLQTQALNRYSYVYNNPLAFVDPSGHEPWGVYGSYQSGVNFDWYGGFIGQSVYFSSSPSGVMSSVSYLQGASIVPSTSAAITVPIDWKAVAGDSAQIFLGYTMGHMEALVPGAMLREQKPVSFFFDLARAAGNLVGGAEGIGVSLEIFGVSGVGEILSGGIATPLAVGGVAAGAVVAANSSAAVAAGAGRLLNLAMSANGKSTGTQETSPRKRLTAEELKEPQAPCAYGCDEVAEDIQAIIGGDIKTLTPKEGGFLPPFREQSQGWFYHKVVVKEGRVFDRSTGLKKSLTIEEYKGLWKDREAINFDF